MTEEPKKLIKTENIKNLFKWEGLAKEFPWLLFVAFILFASYGYKSDIGQCQSMMENSCYQSCRLNEFIRNVELKNPGVKVNCFIDNSTNMYRCEFSGVKSSQIPFADQLEKVVAQINNMSLVPDGK